MKKLTPLILLPCLLAACESQTESPAHDVALGALQGKIVAPADTEPEALEVGLVFTADENEGEGDYQVAYTVDVSGEFPLDFQIDLAAPPPTRAMLDIGGFFGMPDEPRVGVAYIVAGDPGALSESPTESESGGFEGIRGGSETHLLVYLSSDAPAGGVVARFLGELEAGYHVMRYEELTDAEEAAHARCEEELDLDWSSDTNEAQAANKIRLFDACGDSFGRFIPLAEGEGVQVRLDDSVELPNWT